MKSGELIKALPRQTQHKSIKYFEDDG